MKFKQIIEKQAFDFIIHVKYKSVSGGISLIIGKLA
jgi:hypothetical protein